MGTDLIIVPLAEHEATIERGLGTFVEVGEALLAIRDGRLYRESHDTFESYCRERWGFSRQRGNQLIDAAEMTTTVVTTGLPAPANEAQARELAPLKDEPEALAEAWEEASSDGQPTAEKVFEAVRKRKPQKREPIMPAQWLPDLLPGADGNLRGQVVAWCIEGRQIEERLAEGDALTPISEEDRKALLNALKSIQMTTRKVVKVLNEHQP